MDGERLLCPVMTLRERNNKSNDKLVLGSPIVSAKGVESLVGGRSALQPMTLSLNAGLTGLVPSMESKANRQLRSVKRALGTFKAKMKPSGRKCQSTKRRLLDLTVSATPQTPEGVFRLIQSPLPKSTFATPRNTRRYRDAALMLTPYTPIEGLRRSERIASRTPTPIKSASQTSRRQQPRRLQTPGRFEGELDSVTSRLDVLAQGMRVFESIETGITTSSARQESNSSVTEIKIESQDGAAKKALRGKRTSSLTSLKESLQKRLKKQHSDVEMEETPKEETHKPKGTKDKTLKRKPIKEESPKENGSTVKKMQKRESSLSNLKDSLQRSIRPRKRQHPMEKVINEDADEKESENVPLVI